jgi:basic amino acid/polyamine antiporter, APA family
MRNKEFKTHLHVVLGKGFGLAVVLGSTIGIGILRMPGEIALQIKDYKLILLLWLAGGIYSFMAALSFAELAAASPNTGGPYTYVKRAFGERLGFAVGWADWLSFCSVLALLVTVVADYVAALLPSFARNTKGLAVAILWFFVGLSWLGIRTSRRVQEITSFVKLVAFLVLVGACLVVGREWPKGGFSFQPVSLALPLTIATQMILGTYAGWHSAVYFAEENQDPKRDIPKALLTGVGIITVVYLLINVALFRAVPLPQLSGSELAAADAATRIVGSSGGTIILLLCIWSLLSVVNVYVLSSTRILYSLGRDHCWPSFSLVSTNGTPMYALLGNSIIALILVITGSFERLVALASFILVMVYTICLAAHIEERRQRPAAPQVFRAWGYPWSTLFALLVSVAILVAMIFEDPRDSGSSIVLLAVTYGCYRFAAARLPRFRKVRAGTLDRAPPASLAAETTHTSVHEMSSLQ